MNRSVRIEFYGIVRQRVGQAVWEANIVEDAISLREIFRQLERQFPALAGDCLQDGRLTADYLVSLDGNTFVTDPDLSVQPGQTVLILSADAGG